MNDLKFAFRQLLKRPGFIAIAIAMLAIGIGANTTIFSIINAILLKPINVRQPEQLVGLYQHDRDNADSFSLFSYPDFIDLQSEKDAAFSELFAFGATSVGLRGDLTERISANLVSDNYFSTLGVSPALGRVFTSEDESTGAPMAVLSYPFWTKLGSDPSIIGRTLKLTRGDVTVVGVMPSGFTGAQMLGPSMFLPLRMIETLNANPGQPMPRILANRAERRLMLMGRLKPGVSLANADVALSTLNQQFAIPDPSAPMPRTLMCSASARFNFSDRPSRAGNGLAPIASFAFGSATLVLVIACLNLANMMLARGADRRKEIAIRLALGAARNRILRQLLLEGLLLALLGGVAALFVCVWATNLLAAFIYSGSGMPADFPRFDMTPDWRVMVALLLLSCMATVFFALGPAWKLTRLDVNSDLKRHPGETPGAVRAGRFSFRDLLAVGQMAVALALLVAATLFSRSAMNAAEANPGFEFGSNFYIALDPGLNGTSESHSREFIPAAIDRLSAIPGVEAVSPAQHIPFGNSNSGCSLQLGGSPPPPRGAASFAQGKAVDCIYNVVGANYFRTIALPLLHGREFERREADATGAPRVAIISQNLASLLWPGADALGRSVQFPSSGHGAAPVAMTVVGVVPAIQWRLFDKELPLEVYVPLGQDFQQALNLHVRVAPGVNPLKLMTVTREALQQLDPQIAITEIKTLAVLHQDGPNVRVARMGSMLFGAFGALATLLSMLGIYGVKAYSVSRRRREIGIRMALGANAHDVIRMILKETTWLSALGLVLGVLLALAVSSLARKFLYHVPAADPLTFTLIPPLLLAMTLLACFLPAHRAAKVDPCAALRDE